MLWDLELLWAPDLCPQVWSVPGPFRRRVHHLVVQDFWEYPHIVLVCAFNSFRHRLRWQRLLLMQWSYDCLVHYWAHVIYGILIVPPGWHHLRLGSWVCTRVCVVGRQELSEVVKHVLPCDRVPWRMILRSWLVLEICRSGGRYFLSRLTLVCLLLKCRIPIRHQLTIRSERDLLIIFQLVNCLSCHSRCVSSIIGRVLEVLIKYLCIMLLSGAGALINGL
jgi:hypothetical protein